MFSIKSICFSIIEMIRADFSTGNGKEDQITSSSWLTILQCGIRLYLYQIIICCVLLMCAKRLTSFDNLPNQFASKPSFLGIVLLAPIIEEIIFTYSLPRLLPYGNLITPIIFGYIHFHTHPRKWLLIGCSASIGNFLRITFVRANPEHWGATIISHMIRNSIAYVTLSIR
jgi:membrane protease YdiL (CAAX protease family)